MSSKGLTKGLAGLALTCLASVPAHALLLSATNSTQARVDGSSDTRTVSLGAGIITGVTVTLDFMKCDDPLALPLPPACDGQDFGFADEIVFRLTSPQSTVISLIEPNTYDPLEDPAPGVRVTVTLSDAGADLVGANGVVSETAKAIQQFALLNGENALGDWELYLEDTGAADPLGLFSFTLNVTVSDLPTGQIPEPATLALLGLGLAGIGALRRRRR